MLNSNLQLIAYKKNCADKLPVYTINMNKYNFPFSNGNI